jgi:hypothetical protein
MFLLSITFILIETTLPHKFTYYRQKLFIGLSLEMTITDNEEGGSKWAAYIQENIQAYPWTDLKNHNTHMDHYLSTECPRH